MRRQERQTRRLEVERGYMSFGKPRGRRCRLAAPVAEQPRDPRLSADGFWWWDGQRWAPVRRPRGGGMSTGAIVALIAGGAVVVLLTVSVFAFVAYTRLNAALQSSPIVDQSMVPCDGLEHTQVHYHAALQLLDQGKPVPIPTTLGRTATCYYWLHMHSGEAGIIHVEAPTDRQFTLGDFFKVWSAWSGQKEFLDSTHVSTFTLTGDERLEAFVAADGAAPRAFSGDPTSIVLKEREVVTLEISPPTISPPPDFPWPPGF